MRANVASFEQNLWLGVLLCMMSTAHRSYGKGPSRGQMHGVTLLLRIVRCPFTTSLEVLPNYVWTRVIQEAIPDASSSKEIEPS